ncbi:unnamed protein product [Clonostachys rosea]|uniref:Uncharacterized protein n=1 Tax=Bionectria ochroleuca TaxID=29856 RepID=A0ABY6UGT4_BIOOC|nr:unnamed protein product [Clonostachys rosea]
MTITSLLLALVLMFLSSRPRDMKGFASRTPYDLRHYLPSHTKVHPWIVPKEAIWNYTTSFALAMLQNFAPTSLPIARSRRTPVRRYHAHRLICCGSRPARNKRRLESGIVNDMIGIMKFAGDWRAQQESEARKPRCLSWLVTSLGVLEGRLGTGYCVQLAGLRDRTEPSR